MTSRLAALTSGHDVAEAFYSAILFNTRWNTVIFGDPRMPYTIGLLGSIPHLGDAGEGRSRLNEIKGLVPSLFNLPPGCAFAPRCAKGVS